MNATAIEWTDFSASLLKYRDESGRVVWHCEKTSPGCAHCYSEAIAERFQKGGPFLPLVTPKVTPFFDEVEAKKLLRSKKLAGKRVFVNDMTDWMGAWVPDEIIDQHLAVFALRPDVTFQLLTKRPERMQAYMADRDHQYLTETAMLVDGPLTEQQKAAGWMWDTYRDADGFKDATLEYHGTLPLPNVWLGVSVEDQARADERIPHLLQTPAAVRFLSVEPLLGPVSLRDVPGLNKLPAVHLAEGRSPAGVDWVIVGGESGKGARPCRPEWIRSLVRQCREAGVAVFCKQMGSNVVTRNDMVEDEFNNGESGWPDPDVEHHIRGYREDYQGADCRVRLRDPKGGAPEEWPEDLRVREFP